MSMELVIWVNLNSPTIQPVIFQLICHGLCHSHLLFLSNGSWWLQEKVYVLVRDYTHKWIEIQSLDEVYNINETTVGTTITVESSQVSWHGFKPFCMYINYFCSLLPATYCPCTHPLYIIISPFSPHRDTLPITYLHYIYDSIFFLTPQTLLSYKCNPEFVYLQLFHTTCILSCL